MYRHEKTTGALSNRLPEERGLLYEMEELDRHHDAVVDVIKILTAAYGLEARVDIELYAGDDRVHRREIETDGVPPREDPSATRSRRRSDGG